MEGPALASLAITHVSYDPSDPVAHLAAWLSLLPQCLCVVYVSLIWASREVEVALMFVGQMGCEALNFALKRIIKEERPKQMLGKGYGMPSSHSQFLAFFATYITLFLLLRHRPGKYAQPAAAGPLPMPSLQLQIRLFIVAVLAVAVGVAGSRIYLNYHTPRQVLAGATAGVLSAVAWFVVIGVLRGQGIMAWALDMALVRQLRARDLVCEEDIAEAGWEEWERRRAARQVKKTR